MTQHSPPWLLPPNFLCFFFTILTLKKNFRKVCLFWLFLCNYCFFLLYSGLNSSAFCFKGPCFSVKQLHQFLHGTPLGKHIFLNGEIEAWKYADFKCMIEMNTTMNLHVDLFCAQSMNICMHILVNEAHCYLHLFWFYRASTSIGCWLNSFFIYCSTISQ